MIRLLPGLLYLLFGLVLSAPAHAAKTDVVVLHSGDKVTGEVKGLLRGKLEFSTDSMGTVYIEWADIQTIISDTGQSVQLADGQRFFGPLGKSEDNDMVSIETEQGTVEVGSMDVVLMYPVESSFLGRLDIYSSLGFSWDKASSVGKYSIAVDGTYRDPGFITTVGLSSELTTVSGGNNDTKRANAYIGHNVFRANKRFTAYFANMDSNDELGIDLRALAGVGYGWVPVRTNNKMFLLTAGLDINHEIPVDGDPESNLEAVGRVSYEYFRYTDPERSFDAGFTVFPSITDWGRWRADLNADFRLEFISDLYWVFSIFANFDSDPISEEASNSDYGVISSLAYKF
ncbi:MAG: DUF481 domain-containing protein [Xanthomonadales bacterium]|jgi:hypothetical protein|nr:DUF481 domain-containing protein [Xanthomonadales bacterium]